MTWTASVVVFCLIYAILHLKLQSIFLPIQWILFHFRQVNALVRREDFCLLQCRLLLRDYEHKVRDHSTALNLSKLNVQVGVFVDVPNRWKNYIAFQVVDFQ